MKEKNDDSLYELKINDLDPNNKNKVLNYFNSSYTENKLSIIVGTASSWLGLFNDISFKIEMDSLDVFKCSNICRAVIISRRKTNLPIRYSNSPGSEISNVCSGSLYSVSKKFPCTPLDRKFRNFNKSKIIIVDDDINSTKLESALFNIVDNFDESKNNFNMLGVKKRKKEIKCNLEYVSQNISIFPGNTGREYVVFQRYDKGIILDKDAIMDATPEILAQHIARRLRCCTVLDACSGVGGNTIAFSQHCDLVVSVEKSNSRITICKHNSQIYGLYGFISDSKNLGSKKKKQDPTYISETGSSELHFNKKHLISNEHNLYSYFDSESNIVFVNGDVMEFCRWYSTEICKNKLQTTRNATDNKFCRIFRGFKPFDWAFASPPWGGYSYNSYRNFGLRSCKSLNYKDLLIRLSSVADNIALFLPRNSSVTEFIAFMSMLGFNSVEVEEVDDTRYNYTLGLLLYFNRIQDSFRPEYIFGHALVDLNHQITEKLSIFIKNCFNSNLYTERGTIDTEDELKLISLCESLLTRFVFSGKNEKRPIKIGLVKISVLTYLFNYLFSRESTESSLLHYGSSVFVLDEDTLKQIPSRHRKLINKYVEKMDLVINEMKKAFQFSGSE